MYPWLDAALQQNLAYALAVGLGLLAAAAVYYRFPIDTPDKRGFLLFPAALGLLVGAKLPVILSYGWTTVPAYAGKSLLGGLLGAYVAVRLAKRIHGIPWVGGGDAYVLPVSIAVAFGRVGCLFNGCCWGRNGFPAPLLEIAFHLVMFGIVLRWRARNRYRGSWFPIYMLSYCLFRFCTEFIRAEPRVLAGLTVYHGLALLGTLLFAAELYYRGRRETGVAHERTAVE